MDAATLLALANLSQISSSQPQLLSTVTLAASAASVSYTVVTPYPRILCNWGAATSLSGANDQLYLQFNGDTSAHYGWEALQASTTSVSGTYSGTGSSLMSQIQIATMTAGTSTANFWSSGYFLIDGANQSTHYQTIVGNATSFVTATAMWVGTYGGLYAPGTPTPITQLTIFPAGSGSLVAGSQFSFYGLS